MPYPLAITVDMAKDEERKHIAQDTDTTAVPVQ